jgi:hypothetical protein
MDKLSGFKSGGGNHEVSFIETMQVKEGVWCDVYAFVGDNTKDLAIVRVTKGFKTPRQRILQGSSTIEGLLEGKGTFTVQQEDGTVNNYVLDATSDNKEIEVKIGQIMQWAAPDDTDLVFYEICDPPYQDGRFENLPDLV